MKVIHSHAFNDAAFSELTRMMLKGTCRMKLDKISKFLSAILERTDALLGLVTITRQMQQPRHKN